MAIDQDYVKSTKIWIESVELSLEQVKNMIEFHDKEIDIHIKLKSVLNEQLAHDEARLIKAKEELGRYLEYPPFVEFPNFSV